MSHTESFSRTIAARAGLLLLGPIVLMLAAPRPATAGPCKTDGAVCNTSRSCCGTSGNNGLCVKEPRLKFGVCCTPATSCPAGDNCGSVSDGCGDMLDCGTCTAPETCGGGGTPNVCGTPILAIAKAVTGGFLDTIHPGDTASFTITVTNLSASSSASHVVVTDQLPAADLLTWTVSSFSFDTASVSSGGVLTATIASLAAGASGSITVSASIPLDITSLPLDLSNTATVQADGIASITSSEVLITVVSGQP
jgi:uncharacterized repeat protein (TIGR01451 family)